jgi:hypothetical protein
MEFEIEDETQIIIGVTDDRRVFTKNHQGIFEPI